MIPGQTPLTTINVAKEQRISYQPLLLAEITFVDGTVLRLASENLDLTEGGNQFEGHDWKPRILTQDLAAIQSVSDNGILQSPQVSLGLADADKFLWSQYELTIGFKGAKMRLLFVFWDSGTDTFSSDVQVKFVGICNPPSADDRSLTVVATNLLNLANFNLPTVRIGRRCPWIFPVDKAGRIRAAIEEDSDEFECGYSPDVSDSDGAGGSSAARGNTSAPNQATASGAPITDAAGVYVSCDYTWDACIARLGNIALPVAVPDDSHVQIEQDQAGRKTGRFGGIHYDPPDSWRGRAYLTGSVDEGVNQTNEAKFNDYFPMAWGVGWAEPPVMHVNGDPNSTRFDVVLCVGKIQDASQFNQRGPIQMVIVNDFVVPFIGETSDFLLCWSWVNGGDRSGQCDKGALYNGRGDPYGSLAAINITVYRKVQDSSSIPNVRVLFGGPAVRIFNSGSPSDFTRMQTVNSVPIALDMLTWASFKATPTQNDFNLQTWVDMKAVADAPVSYTDLTGTDQTHTRYRAGIVLRDRRSAAEIIKNFLAGFRGYLYPDDNGNLAIGIRQTIADEQPAPMLGSNDDTPFASATGAGNPAFGYVAYHFDDSSILRAAGSSRDAQSSLKVEQRPISDTPNRIQVLFQDEDNIYSPDSINDVDSGDVARAHQEVSGGVAAEGIVNFDQGRRIQESTLAEQYRGNPRSGSGSPPLNNSGGTWIFDLDTTFKAIRLRVGNIIAITSAKYGIDSQLFRVIAVGATANCERISIRAVWHEDDWYLDTYGQQPDPLLQAQRKHRLARPPFGWLPSLEHPPGTPITIFATDPMWLFSEKTFGIAQSYAPATDGTVITAIRVQGHLPVNSFSNKTSPPFAPRGETDASGGKIPAGHYYLALCGIDADGNITAPFSPPTQVETTGTSSTITLPNIYWQEGTVGYKLYAGTNPNKLSLQLTDPSTPDSITITGYMVADEAMPDVQFDHMVLRAKTVEHAGVWGLAVNEVHAGDIHGASGYIVIGEGIGFSDNEFQGRTLSFLSRSDATQNLKILNFKVSSHVANRWFFDHVADHSALGIEPNDVAVCRTAPDIVSHDTIGDTKFVNEVDYFDPPIPINGAAGSPIILQFSTPHDFVTGDNLEVAGVRGNSAANGRQTSITVPSTGVAAYDQFHVILSVDSNGDYEGGGTATFVTNGFRVNGEVGRIVRIIAGTGRYQKRKILSNTTTTLTVDGDWLVLPDATSVFIIEDDLWNVEFPTTPVQVSDSSQVSDLTFPVDSLDQILWVQAFTANADGTQESIELDSPGREIFAVSGPGNNAPQFDKATFNIAVIIDLEVDADVAPHYIVRRPGNLDASGFSGIPASCAASAKVPSDGDNIVLDVIIFKADLSYEGSIFNPDPPPGQKILIPDGSTDVVFQNDFKPGLRFEENDILTVNVENVGTIAPGRVVTIVLKWAVS